MRKLLFSTMLMLCISLVFGSCGNKNRIKGYEWLEGTWEIEEITDYGEKYLWAKLIITPSTYKLVHCYKNNSIEEISEATEYPIAIAKFLDDNDLMFTLDTNSKDRDNCEIVFNVEQRENIILYCSSGILVLYKNGGNSYEVVNVVESSDSVKPTDTIELDTDKAHGSSFPIMLDFAKTYVREDDFLIGEVKRVEETFQEDDILWWNIVKEYDKHGRLCSFQRKGSERTMICTVFPQGFPIPQKIGGLNPHSSAYKDFGRFLNPLHMLGYVASKDKWYFEEGLYTWTYTDLGKIENIYCDGNLVNRCEYDEFGRLLKRYENGLPTLQIMWETKDDGDQSGYCENFEVQLRNTDGERIEIGTYEFTWTENLFGGTGHSDMKYKFADQSIGMKSALAAIELDDYKCDIISHIDGSLEILEHYPGNHISHIFKYNNNGHIVEYYNNDHSLHNRWEYKYDSSGNWIEATKYKVTVGEDITFEEELNTIIRKYEYYE